MGQQPLFPKAGFHERSLLCNIGQEREGKDAPSFRQREQVVRCQPLNGGTIALPPFQGIGQEDVQLPIDFRRRLSKSPSAPVKATQRVLVGTPADQKILTIWVVEEEGAQLIGSHVRNSLVRSLRNRIQ